MHIRFRGLAEVYEGALCFATFAKAHRGRNTHAKAYIFALLSRLRNLSLRGANKALQDIMKAR